MDYIENIKKVGQRTGYPLYLYLTTDRLNMAQVGELYLPFTGNQPIFLYADKKYLKDRKPVHVLDNETEITSKTLMISPNVNRKFYIETCSIGMFMTPRGKVLEEITESDEGYEGMGVIVGVVESEGDNLDYLVMLFKQSLSYAEYAKRFTFTPTVEHLQALTENLKTINKALEQVETDVHQVLEDYRIKCFMVVRKGQGALKIRSGADVVLKL